MKDIVEKLTSLGKTVSTMESCTGGGVANAITNIEGASTIIKESIVTYSNEAKIKYGVSEDVINTYTVYSSEVAIEMSKAVSNWTGSDYGIGITGQLNRVDENNPYGIANQVFICIYDKENDVILPFDLYVTGKDRKESKEQIIELIVCNFKEYLNQKKYRKNFPGHV